MVERRLPKMAGEFSDDILVVCPRCGGMANVRKANMSQDHSGLVCTKCAYAPKSLPAVRGYRVYFDGLDPFYGLPLWLRDGVGSKTVWARNWRHFEDLEYFVTGEWRQDRQLSKSSCTGGPFSYRNRLPRWMHLQSNRPHILRALKRIKARRF